jgi:hypothetical protein
MRIGVIGEAHDTTTELRRAAELLLSDREVTHIIYLGNDDSVDAAVAKWASEALSEPAFLERGAALACGGSATEIEALLSEDRAAQRLTAIRKLPEPPACAIEMIEKWIVLLVHDTSILEEDDVANAHVIVYGKAADAEFKRFGPRSFFTPGPLSKGRVGRLTLRDDGALEVDLLDLDGNSVRHEEITPASAKVVVTS